MAYKTLEDTFWTDPDFEHLSFEEHSFLGYLITNRHAHYCGIYYLPKLFMADETRLTLERVDEYLEALAKKNSEGKFSALYDEKCKVVWVKNMLRYQARATNKKTTLQGTAKQIPTVHGTPLVRQFITYYKEDIGLWLSNPKITDDERERIVGALTVAGGALPAGSTPLMLPVKPQAPVEPPKEPVAPDGEGKPPKPVKPAGEKLTFVATSCEYTLSELLYNLILKHDKQFKKPNLQAWSKDMDLIFRVDKRLYAVVRDVIEWCQADGFWQDNILSVNKLRKQFDQLRMKMEKEKGGDSHVSVERRHYDPKF